MSARPALLFSADTLGLFGEGLARYHPLSARDRALACYWTRTAPPHTPASLPGDGRVDAHDPAMMALVEDVLRALRSISHLARSIFAPSEGEARIGFASHTSYDAARAQLARHAALTEAHDLRALAPDLDASSARTEARVRELVGGDRSTDPARRAYRAYLLDGGAAPTLTLRRMPRLHRLLADTPPTRFDPVQRRALDLVARVPEWLHRAESALCFDDPTEDIHRAWRALLEARGVSPWAMETAAMHAFTHPAWAWAGSDPSPRTWWLLHRARADVPGFVARHASLGRPRVLESLFSAALTYCHAPGFAEVGESLLETHGAEIPATALSWALATRRARVAPLLDAHARTALDPRPPEDRAHLRAMMRPR